MEALEAMATFCFDFWFKKERGEGLGCSVHLYSTDLKKKKKSAAVLLLCVDQLAKLSRAFIYVRLRCLRFMQGLGIPPGWARKENVVLLFCTDCT